MNNSFFATNPTRGYNNFSRNDFNNNINRSYHAKITFTSYKSNPLVVKLRGGTKIILGNDRKMNIKYKK
jgi:hypothetical protein